LLLDALKQRSLKATFCVVGNRVMQYPDIVKRAFDEGHEICVHTWSHWALTSMSADEMLAELEWTRKIVQEVTGVTPRYYRPPYGDVDNRVRTVAKAVGLKGALLWNRETNDWKLNTDSNALVAVGGVKGLYGNWTAGKAPLGIISLQHDRTEGPVTAAIEALDILSASASWKAVTVSQCRGEPWPPVKPILNPIITNTNVPNSRTTSSSQPTNNSRTGNHAARVFDYPAAVGYGVIGLLSLALLLI
jgi:hypothetical protein